MEKVEQFKVKNQFIIRNYDKKTITFQSYDSTIAIINDIEDTLTLGKYWSYSRTTSKYLYMFLDEELKYSFKGINGGSLTSELREQDNKRAYIQKCIDKNIIKYDEGVF